MFTSGASFIGGVGDKKAVADAVVAASPVSADKADASSVPGAPPKMDRAAAELLRPMLRQWLADNMPRIVEDELLRPMLRQWLAENMPRIVEDALRSELTEQTQGDGKGPGNPDAQRAPHCVRRGAGAGRSR